MSNIRIIPSGRTCKILGAIVLLVALAVALPTFVLASAEPADAQRPVRGVLGSGDHAAPFAPSEASGSELELSTLGPNVLFDWVESGSGSWTATSTWAITTEWLPPWEEPGNHSWSDSPSANYANNADSTLTSGIIDLSAAAVDQEVMLYFSCNYALELNSDFLYVELSSDGGSSWSYLGDYLTGTDPEGWYFTFVPASFHTNQFRLRFRLVSDSSVTADGVHIDGVQVYTSNTDMGWADDARLAYFGTWATTTRPYSDGGTWTYKSSNRTGDLIKIDFTGPAIMVNGKMGPTSGIASVSLDGGTPTEADYYWDPASGSDYNQYPMGIVWLEGLTDAPHTLTICCSGTKNPASTGYTVSLESVAVWGSLDSATGPVRYQQDDTHLAREGTWGTSNTWLCSGGSMISADSAGSAIRVGFSGTYLAWVAKKGPGYGKAQVSLDSGPLVPVDLYRSYDSYKQRVYNTGLLADGAHTLDIYWTGQKNSASWGTKIGVDALDVLDTITGTTVPTPITWRYQQTDPKLTWLGSWALSSTWSASGGSFRSTSKKGDAVIISWRGDDISLIARTVPWGGKAAVTVDGGTEELVSFYSSTTLYKQPVFSTTGLSPGDHRLIVKCLGSNDGPPSSGYSVSVDALDIKGWLVDAQRTSRVQETDAVYTAPWTSNATWQASGGTYATLTGMGSKAVYTFYGSYCALIAKTAPWYGRAEVTLDGLTTTQVDFYSPTITWKKMVYNTGLLSNATHTLQVKYLGSKYWASTGYVVDADAFDVLGPILW